MPSSTIKRYHIHVAGPAQPLRQARTKFGARLTVAWLRLTTFGLRTIVVRDTFTGAVISRG